MAINPSKLLGSASYISPRMSGGVFVPKKELIVVKNQVIEIKNLIKTSTLLKQAEAVKQRKTEEQERFRRREDELEKKTEPGTEKIKVPGLPKLGFLEGLKKFIFTVLLGRFIVKMLPQASKLTDVVKNIAAGIEFATDFAGKLFNALATFVDKGYKAYDATRGFLKAVGGDNTLKLFDGFTKAIDATIIAAIALASMPDPFGPDKGPDIKEKAVQQTSSRFARRGLIRAFGRGGAKNILKFVRPFTKRLPLIGAFLDFGLSVALGESLGRAAFKSIGALLGSAVLGAAGSVIPVVGNFAGAVAGGFLGDQLGGSLYDLFFGGKIPQQKTVKAAGGGTPPATRGGKFVSGPAQRTFKKPKRAISGKVGALKPGADVGGKDKIEKVFPSPDPKNKDKDKQVNPLGYIQSSYKKMTSSKAFGGLMALPLKTLAGQTPTQLDYRIAAQGLNFWLNSTFSPEVKRGGVAGFAGGGEVNAAAFMSGEDMTNVIAKSLQDSVSSQLDDALNDLMKQLMLKPREVERGQPTPPGGGDITGLQGSAKEYYDYLISKGVSPNNAMGLVLNIARESSFTPGVQIIDVNGQPSGGLFQWNAGRFTNMTKAVPDWKTNWRGQIDYALAEPQGAASGSNYLATKFNSPMEAAIWWMEKWERVSDPARDTVKMQKILDTWTAQGMKQGQGPPASLGNVPGNLSVAQQLAASMGLQVTSHVRPGDPGYHGAGRAMDFQTIGAGGNTGTPSQLAFANAMVSRYGSNLAELIYTPLGFSIKNGKVVAPMSAADHYNHVHVAFFGGGPTGKGGLTMTHPGEYIIDKDSVDAFGINFFDIVNKVENMSQRQQASKQLMGILQFYAGYESGGRQKIKVRIPAPQTTVVPVPVPVGGGMMVAGGGSGTRPQDVTYRG